MDLDERYTLKQLRSAWGAGFHQGRRPGSDTSEIALLSAVAGPIALGTRPVTGLYTIGFSGWPPHHAEVGMVICEHFEMVSRDGGLPFYRPLDLGTVQVLAETEEIAYQCLEHLAKEFGYGRVPIRRFSFATRRVFGAEVHGE